MRKEQLASKPKESALAAIRNTLSILVHSEPGAGKSWFGQTSPRPILTLVTNPKENVAADMLSPQSV